MSTQETSVANISTYATAAVGVTTLSITSGVLVADTLASVSGYTTLQVGTNGAHVIDIPSAFLTTSGATLTVSVTSTLSVSLTGANLVGSSTALAAANADDAPSRSLRCSQMRRDEHQCLEGTTCGPTFSC